MSTIADLEDLNKLVDESFNISEQDVEEWFRGLSRKDQARVIRVGQIFLSVFLFPPIDPKDLIIKE